MQVKILVTVNVEATDDAAEMTNEQVRASTAEAVSNALKQAEDWGFDHALSDVVGLTIESVQPVVAEDKDE